MVAQRMIEFNKTAALTMFWIELLKHGHTI